jgi:Ca2+-binding RTX toxin-like protein
MRDEGARVFDANIDIHASGPDDNLSFCDPTDANPRAAPDEPETDHTSEGPGQSSHAGSSPLIKHTEGFTSEDGDFTFGVISNVQGDSTIQAWFDEDWGDDVVDTDVIESFEEIATATVSWGATLETAQVGFVNPSAYGNPTDGGGDGTQVSNVRDADNRYHIVTRTNAVAAPGMELFISEDGESFTKLGDATQIGGTDTWEFFWDVNIPDGVYTLRAQLFGTSRNEDIEITVNKTGPGPSDQDPTPAEETVEITSPVDGSVVGISRREINVRGATSAGADGVDLFYTKAPSFNTPTADDWIFCGFVKPASGSFNGKCTMDPSDQAAHITGIAAIAYDCFQSGCSGQENESPFRDPGENDSGDAHRIFGLEADPIISLEPAEAQEQIGFCQRFELKVADTSGQALGGENVDIHVSGPEDIVFCDPEGASTRRAPGDGGHVTGDDPNEGTHEDGTKHIEAETGRGGRVIFGLNSRNAGDTQISAWIDRTENDVPDSGEPLDTSVMHWRTKSQVGRCTKVGTRGRDILRGTRGRDKLCGKGGRDVLRGVRGNDILVGGRGKDKLIGGRGRDRLKGGRGNDRLRGGRGRDRCTGGRGRDSFATCERRRQ